MKHNKKGKSAMQGSLYYSQPSEKVSCHASETPGSKLAIPETRRKSGNHFPAFSMNHLKRAVCFALVFVMLLPMLPVNLSLAFAEGNDHVVTYGNNQTKGFVKFSEAWDFANSKNGTIDMHADAFLGRQLTLSEGHKVTINMNGYMINRGKTNPDNIKKVHDSGGDGTIFLLEKKSHLIINGGTDAESKARTHKGRLISDVWYYDNKGSTVFNGALITGSGSDSYECAAFNVSDHADLTIKDVNIAGNVSDDYSFLIGHTGGTGAVVKLLSNSAYHDAASKAQVHMENCTIYNNYARSNGAVISVGAHENAIIELIGCKIASNVTDGEGGVIYVSEKSNGASITLTKTWIHDNTAKNGAAIYIEAEGCTIEGGKFEFNHARENGGAIYLKGVDNSISNATINSNDARGKGGGVFIYQEDCALISCAITNNKAGDNGGGVFLNSNNLAKVPKTRLGGKLIIADNTVGGKKNNLYLEDPYLHRPPLIRGVPELGSEIWVTYGDEKTGVISYVPDSYNDAVFHSDNSKYNIYWGRDEKNADEFRHLIIGTGKSQRIVLDAVALNPGTGDFAYTGIKQLKETEYYRYRDWPVYMGYGREDSPTSINAYYYSDGYFQTDPTMYNEHLASLSLRMAAAGFNSGVWSDTENNDWEYQLQPIHVKQMLSDIGIADEDIYLSDSYFVKPQTDSIACAIGSKKLLDPYGNDSGLLLVPIVVRGQGYEMEWASNVTIGSEGLHQGFNEAATTIIDNYLDEYLEQHPDVVDKLDEGKVRFWVVGFSRAGATANLVSKKLIDEYQSKGNVVYGYTLEAPQGGVDSEENKDSDYTTIHNVVLSGDLVPNVAMVSMGFKRFGVDHYLPGTDAFMPSSFSRPYYNKLTKDYQNSTDDVFMRDNIPSRVGDNPYEAKKKIMLRQLAASDPEKVFDDYFHLATVGGKSFFTRTPFTEFGRDDVTLESWLADFSYYLNRWLVDGLRDARNEYIDSGEQATLRKAMELLMGGDGMNFGRVVDRAVSWSFIPEAIWILLSNATDFDEFVNKLTALCEEVGFFDDDAIPMSADEAKALVRIVALVAWGDLTKVKNYQEGTVMNYGDDDEYLVMIPTLLYNAERILQNHRTGIVFAWLRTYDSYYTDNMDHVSDHYFVGNRASSAKQPYLIYELNEDGEKHTLMAGEELTMLDTDKLTYLALCNDETNQGGLIFYNMKCGGGQPAKADKYYSGTTVFEKKNNEIKITGGSAVIVAKTIWHDAPSDDAIFNISVKRDTNHKVYILKPGEKETNLESGYDFYCVAEEGDSFTVKLFPEEGWNIIGWNYYIPNSGFPIYGNIDNIAQSVSEDMTTLQIKMPGPDVLRSEHNLYLVPTWRQRAVYNPVFSVKPGEYDHDIWVELSTPAGTEEEGFYIKYKMESHSPDYDGEYGAGDYTSPLLLFGSENGPVTWKLTAQAFHEGWLPSSEVTVEYTINYRNRVFIVDVIGGTLTDTGKSVGTFHTGDVVRITASDPEGSTFSVWSVSPDTVNIDNVNAADTSFTMPYHDVTIAASFEVLDVPTPIYVENGEAYNESGEKITEALPGQCVYLLARDPQTDSNGDQTERFISWTGPESVSFADADSEKTTFIMPLLGYPENGVHLKANFQGMYKITVNNGTARNAAGDIVTYASEGERITITPDAMDDPERVFIKWEFDTVPAEGLNLTQQSISFEMPAQDVTATAIFRRMYKITVNNGTARNAAGDIVTYAAEGEKITITPDATDSPERVFSKWEFAAVPAEGLNLTQQSISFEMPAWDVTATAIFQRMYKITVSNGTARNAAGDIVTYAAEGEMITITPDATDSPERVFSKWEFAAVPAKGLNLTQPSISFAMPAWDVTATAIFQRMYRITVINGYAMNAAGNVVTYAAAGEIITITPNDTDNPDHIFSRWSFETVPAGVLDLTQRSLSFSMPGYDVTVTADFKGMYQITVTHGHAVNRNGQIVTYAAEGERITIIPDTTDSPERVFSRWEFATVPAGVSDLTQRSLGFDMPKHDVMVTAKFQYAIKVIHGHAEDAQGKTITIAFPGEKVILVPDASPKGKIFDRWQVSPGLKANAANRSMLVELILPVASADNSIALIGNELIMPESAVTAEAMYSAVPVIPQTGDNSMPVLWTLLGIGSILRLIYLQSKGRKKEMH